MVAALGRKRQGCFKAEGAERTLAHISFRLTRALSHAEAVHQLFGSPGTIVVVRKLLLHQIFDCLVDGASLLRQNTPAVSGSDTFRRGFYTTPTLAL